MAVKIIIPARAYQPDVIHSYGGLTLLAAYIAGYITGAQWLSLSLGSDFHHIKRSKLLTQWLGLADAIVCVSQHMVIELRKKLPNKPIHYCPPGAHFRLFTLIILLNVRMLLSVWALTTVKRYDLILDAFAKIIQANSDYRLVIMGRGDLLDDLLHQSQRLGISEKVVFGGVVGKEGGLRKYYVLLDCFY